MAERKMQLNDTLQVSHRDYENLLKYITARLSMSKDVRNQYIETFRYIDREYYSYLKRDQEDHKRKRDTIRGLGIKPSDEKLSMIFSQLDEAQTYLLSVLAPDDAIYSAIAPKEQQSVADGFAALMNQHAEAFGHYENYSMFLLDCLRYNLGGFGVNWLTVNGIRVNERFRTDAPEETVVQDGNEIYAFDPYNLLLDGSVNPIHTPNKGEWFAYVEQQTPFRLKKMQDDGDLFNVDDFVSTEPKFVYYEQHPMIRTEGLESENSVNWINILRAEPEAKDSRHGFELVPVYIWLRPNDFKLSAETRYQIWRIILGADTHILHAQQMTNLHGMLPANIAVPFRDHFNWQTKGPAERLIPHQNFASFIMNTHQRAARKRLYGLTVYNQNVIPLMDNDDVDMAGGKVPANPSGTDVDLRRHIVQFNDGPDTTNTLQNIEIMNGIMQGVLPTNILQQVAGLERATQYQAASLVQGANRRNLKIAKLINAQAMDRGRRMQMYNIQQFQQNMEILDEQGQLVQIDPKQFISTKLEFKISDGLKGLDRLALQINMKELIAMVLQSQQAAAQTDVMALIDYLSTLFGDYTDFKQFKIQSPLDALPAETRNLAFQLLQQAQAAAEEQRRGGQGGQGGQQAPIVPTR